MNWKPEGQQYKWLEDLLSKSKADFIFFCTHFPAWSSGYHTNEKAGKPKEKTIRTARNIIMPLLQKYKVTAMFAGHEHFYERSEPDSGVSVIVTGGAGAPLRKKEKNAEKQNPYSKVFASKLHYCILEIKDKVCTMEVFTPEGEKIDTHKWKARNK